MRGNSRDNAGQVSRLWRVTGKLVDVPPHRFELPAEAFDLLGVVVLQRQQLVDQARDHVRAERKPCRPLTLLLALDPGTLEERLVGESSRRCPDLTEQELRCK